MPGTKRVTQALSERIHASGQGPSDAVRARVGSRIVAIAYDRTGRELAYVELAGDNAYDFTARILAIAGARAQEGAVSGSGALGPVEAYGLRALEEMVSEAGIRRVGR
ncbi:hypothetical protein [Thermoleophilum album]|uniref:hypothetical protein n=1 Tax=Thermoleophilum album TaxID=29539 RepID=UPI00115F8DA1|nr:hypothetical protein [Thermoleophilum album]